MIYIKNQITAIFSIGDYVDFITPDNFESLILYEQAGNLIPLLKLSFTLTDTKILKYINQGNTLIIGFGIDEPSNLYTNFQIINDCSNIDVSLGSTVQLTARLYLPLFTEYTRSTTYSDCYSYQVIQQIASRHNFNLVTNVSKTNDLQTWHQNGITDWEFLRYIWYSSYLNDNTFYSLAIDGDSIYFYDKKNQVADGPKWTLTPATSGGSIVNIGQYYTQNNSALRSAMAGKNVTNCTYNVDTGRFTNNTYKLRNLTVLDSDKLNINTTNCRQYTYDITTKEMNNNISAKNQNVRNNVLYDSYTIFTSVAGQFKKFRLLDLCLIIPSTSDERVLGLAFITGITYQWTDQTLSTNLTLNKEAPNGIKSDNLLVGE